MEARSKVETYESIRWGHRDGASIRQLSDSHRVHRRTVREALEDAVPAPRKQRVWDLPVSGQWEPVVHGWLVADQEVHRKQRHTAKRMWERLVEEHDAVISESTVRAMVARLKVDLRIGTVDVAIVQTHLAGAEAEVDFGEFWMFLDTELVKVHLFVMRLSCSGKSVHFAYASPSCEAFLDGHVRAFAAFGGVPGRIRYDNLTAAVIKVLLGRERLENERFLTLRSHYFFESFFCVPGIDGAHEKGGVEGEIGRFRRRWLTPQPVFSNVAALDEMLAAADAKDDERRIHGRRQTIGECFAAEASALAPLPDTAFDPATITSARVDTKARIAVRSSHYSVPARLVGRRVEVAIGGMAITVRSGGKVVAVHPRSLVRHAQVLDLDHYLEVLIRKPGALAGATALARAKAAKTFGPVHQQFWDTARRKHGDSVGTRELIGVLLLHRTMAAEAVIAGMNGALLVGSTDPDVVAVQARCHQDARREVPMLAPTGTDTGGVPAIAWERAKPTLVLYDTLLANGANR